MQRFTFSSFALVCVLLGVAAPAYAEDRPFYADGEGAQLLGSGHPVTFIGNGNATHFGLALLGFDVNRDALNRLGELRVSSALLGAANGDGVFVDIDVVLDPSTGLAVGTLTFRGGTGRFKDATGSADIMLLFGTRYESFAFLIDGMINY